ncbi:hypothetical protein C8Q75DRAFT_733976 [Abortiporus biennis]|nr:hypothetical protein C8Q75DRAFT_733976 [Abortiporus biennis]
MATRSDKKTPDAIELKPTHEDTSYIAIEPPSPRSLRDRFLPPSFESAQYDIVLRRQHQRPRDGGGMKFSPVPSRFLNLTNTFEFSGWGTLTRTKFDSATISKGEEDLQNIRRRRTLGQFTASALAGNAVLGSVSMHYLPLWLCQACFWSYSWETHNGGTRISPTDWRSPIHVSIATILVMFIASIIAWAHTGNAQIRENWNTTISENRTPSGIAQEIFNGLCLSVLVLTGFECTPSYVSNIKGGDFPKFLVMLFSFALLPMETILGGANVLSELGDIAAGKWLRQWIVVDAFIVLCGGV